MNLIGKILTLFIFFMSVCFLVLSVMVGASHRNWKAAAEEFSQKAKTVENQRDEAKASTTNQLKILEAERVSRALQLAQLESQLKVARENLVAKENQLREEVQISQDRLTQLEQAEARLTQLDKEVADFRSTNKNLTDDIASQFKETRVLTNKLFELENTITLLTEKEKDLVTKLAKSQRVLKANGLTENSLTDSIVPKLEGTVVKLGADGLFAVSLGSDDGVKVGHEMDIYRRDRYVGKATVVNIQPDIAALRVKRDFMRDTVQEGDYVTSKF